MAILVTVFSWIPHFFYRTFFGYQAQVGSPTMGAAVATLMFLVILLGVAVYFYFVQRKLTRYEL